MNARAILWALALALTGAIYARGTSFVVNYDKIIIGAIVGACLGFGLGNLLSRLPPRKTT